MHVTVFFKPSHRLQREFVERQLHEIGRLQAVTLGQQWECERMTTPDWLATDRNDAQADAHQFSVAVGNLLEVGASPTLRERMNR